MSTNINNTKANIKKRLSIPSISEIAHKDKLLQTLKTKEEGKEHVLKKRSTQDITALNEINFDKDNKSNILKDKIHKAESSNLNEKKNLKYKMDELQKELKEKEEEMKKIQNKLEEEKNRNQKMSDILAKKDIKINTLKNSIKK